ncbi:MAG: GFA family protein [Silicimonas sp.]|nr:GFA family protein [Silicimonas sp.]
MTQLNGQCTCGEIRFETARPLLRAYCHCEICKSYHNRDFADFTVFRARDFRECSTGSVSYKAYKQPPLLRRGHCDSCAAPILEKANIPGLPRLMLIPSRWIIEHEGLPEPSFHMFYNLRRADATDGLPKANGYLASQLKFAVHLLPALRR